MKYDVEQAKVKDGDKMIDMIFENSAVSQKRCEIGPKLLLMTNRKWHTPCRLVPKSTTLDDLERPIRIPLQKGCVFRSPLQKSA